MAITLSTFGASTTGTVSSPGLGSGIDVNSLVTNLVAATITPQQTLIQQKQAQDQATISSLGAAQSVLFGLQASVNALTTGGALQDLTVTSASPTNFTATAGSAAVQGSYSVKVDTLAQGNKISSDAYSSSAAVVGNGSFTITAGGSTFTVSLAGTEDTLQDLANAINSSPDNSGVSATIINSTDGAHLMLNATKTGVANAVSISSALLQPFSSVQGASDAKVYIDGFEYDSASNTITGALNGITINLLKADASTAYNMSVSPDVASAASSISAFVNAYNTAIGTLLNYTSYDSTTGQAGALLGNSGVTSALQQLQSIESSQVSSNGANAITGLSQLGITVNADGSLSLDSAKLNSALGQNLNSVQNLLSGPNGIMTRMNTVVENVAGPGGVLSSQAQTYQTDYKGLSQKLTDLQSESQQLTQRYLSQFNAMNAYVAQYNQLSNMLTQTFANWNNVTTSNKG